jgi:hypothetical protein
MPVGSTSIRAINLPRFWYYSFHWSVDRKEQLRMSHVVALKLILNPPNQDGLPEVRV